MVNFNDEKFFVVFNFFDMLSEVCWFYMGMFYGFFLFKVGIGFIKLIVCKLIVLVYVINKYYLFLLLIKDFCVF